MSDTFSEEGMKADPEKMAAILDMPRPTGFTNYLSKFLPHLSEI